MSTQAFFSAISAGDKSAIDDLLRAQPDLLNARNDDGVSTVLTALYRGKREIAEHLVERGQELDFFDAAALGDLEALAEFLDADRTRASDWSSDGFMAIHLAAFFGQPDALEFLLLAGSPPDLQARHPFGVRPLHSAAANDDPEKAQAMAAYLIEAGADVNATQGGGEYGFTPLMAAAQHGDAVLTQMLLDAGADASVTTAEGKTALMFAEDQKSETVVGLLRG